MTITRTVDGVERTFELTAHEMYNAYFEQQHAFDIEDAEMFICDYIDTHDNTALAQIRAEGGKAFKKFLDEMASVMRRYIDNTDDGDCAYYSRQEAMEETLRRFQNG